MKGKIKSDEILLCETGAYIDDHKTMSSWLEEVVAMICFVISLGQFISALQEVAEE